MAEGDGKVARELAQELGLESSGPRLTDWGNAQRLVSLFGSELRYCHPWQKWLVWDGKRWAIDETGAAVRKVKDTILAMHWEADNADDEEFKSKLAKWATRTESEARIKATLSLAKSEDGVPVLPDMLDSDPWLLNVFNGTLDLRSGELGEHRTEDLITKLAPVQYDPAADCPLWIEFLDRILAGSRQLMIYLQRIVGYALTGDVSEQVLPILWGAGANGKSTFLNTLLKMWGDYGRKAPADLLMVKRDTHPTEKTVLFGARLVAAIETEEGRRLAESFIKEATGGDPITARRMREDFWRFYPTHKIFLATNHKPVIRGTDHAIWRRPKLIPFTVVIPDDEQDRYLGAKLVAEAPGILNWALRGCLEWQSEGLGEPSEVQRATSDYRSEMDSLRQFLEDWCVVIPEATVTSADLYAKYQAWAKENGERAAGSKTFAQQLQERGFAQIRLGHHRHRGWTGLGLLGEEYQLDLVTNPSATNGADTLRT